jgi:hypothetical protein
MEASKSNWKKQPLLAPTNGKLAPNHILVSRRKPLKVYQERVHKLLLSEG